MTMPRTDTVCQCGDRSRPHINHRMRVPCWTYLGDKRYDVDKDGRIAMMHYEIEHVGGGGQVSLGVSTRRGGRIHGAITVGKVESIGGPVPFYNTLCGRTMRLLPESFIEEGDKPCQACQRKWRIVNVGGVWFGGQGGPDA